MPVEGVRARGRGGSACARTPGARGRAGASRRPSPAADTGADRDVAESVEPPCCSPAMLAERGGVDVGVEGDRHREAAADLLADVGVRPAGFRRRSDVAPGRRRRPSVDGAERADPDRGDRPFALEERDDSADRLLGSRRRDRCRSRPDRRGRVPIAHSHLEPPASIPPYTLSRPARRRTDWRTTNSRWEDDEARLLGCRDLRCARAAIACRACPTSGPAGTITVRNG